MENTLKNKQTASFFFVYNNTWPSVMTVLKGLGLKHLITKCNLPFMLFKHSRSLSNIC